MFVRRNLIVTAAIAMAAMLAAACETVPITGRSQLNFIDPATEAKLGAQAFAQVKAESKISNDPQANETVRRVAMQLIKANALAGDWEFIVIDESKVNAFALPGGYIAVYKPMLSVAQSDAALATVIAHEIGHVIAHHGAERISRSQLMEAGTEAASLLLGGVLPADQQTVAALLGAGVTFGVEMPFSRDQEYEADRIGLMLMARAGYDPREAVEFWKRMMARGGGNAPPELLSDHPSDENRIQRLNELMPQALEVYRAAS
ncbi:MAG TPA: M48 family metallopeptidase [Alphaproteobacteria bacterium]